MRNRLDVAVMASLAFALYINLVLVVERWGIVLPAPPDTTRTVTIVTLVFSLLHATRLLGLRQAAVFFGLSGVVSWTFEEVGVASGLVYGRYHYTDLLGPKLGHVPILIPLAWFAMIYPSYVIACWLIDGAARPARGHPMRILWRAWIAGMVMTAWDVVLDPTMTQSGAWVWHDGGPYFGVPRQNFVGWMLTTLSVYSLFGWWARPDARPPAGEPARWLGALPPLVYGVMAARYSLDSSRGALGVVAFFVMGLPCLVALGRCWDDHNAVASSRRAA